jgi:hypothetical protein
MIEKPRAIDDHHRDARRVLDVPGHDVALRHGHQWVGVDPRVAGAAQHHPVAGTVGVLVTDPTTPTVVPLRPAPTAADAAPVVTVLDLLTSPLWDRVRHESTWR